MLIIAHRGASAYEAENTLAAFKRAIMLKADAIECDVRLTADYRLAVIHDATINRTTSGKGNVSDYTLNQLKQYNIPELQEVISLVKPTQLFLFIEIKDKGTEQQIVDLIRKNKVENKALVVSFYAESIAKVKKLNNIRTGLIFSKLKEPIATALKVKADFIIPRYDVVTRNLVESAHKNKLRIIPWVVDDVRLARKLQALGVDGIATNKPDLLN